MKIRLSWSRFTPDGREVPRPASARNLHKNPQILNGLSKCAANAQAIVGRMGKVITIQFRRSRLPRRLLNDGWWLESEPIRPTVIVLPERRTPDPKPGVRHLTLVRPEK